jgi:hypothetical protein
MKPSASETATGQPTHLFCPLCKTKFQANFPPPRLPLDEWKNATESQKIALIKEWGEHLSSAHPHQWEREQRKAARRSARGE